MRYFLHLRGGIDETLDSEGLEFTDAEALKKAVLASARDSMGNELKSSGVVDLRYRIDAEDEEGKAICSLSFPDAVNIASAS